ncbi:monosaccharide ABC transporter substrate-binding protein, CUT2 family [Thermomonospora echinospora]|uniref:Monosaccharide ABC transporter substrate-binding protein, CUT2 family n=1 Tax=Thermomonospora echinospora TaxID=1992 RepID=A0A1H6E692_9ACTN|nr:sugar ABC transporter substrate-binding protein [Thermomonospora echinospora]SEG92486.1 monosaccharide ABC transporter substrate-binding protein, CUT2 family [Thermomonospora echinospora]
MRKGILSVAAISVVAALTLTACGDDSGDDAEGGQVGAVKGKVGVILPDTKSSARYESFDRPYLAEAFKAAGVQYDIQNAEGSAQRFQTIADQMITSGVTVLLIDGIDSNSAAAVTRKAQQQGVKTIDYDRLTLGGVSDYYVSFDNVKVGEELGKGLQKCLGDKDANIVYLNGAPTDNNATLFAQGAHSVLDKVSGYKKVAEQAVPGWDNQRGATIFEQMWTQQNGKIDGVLAANDGLGNAAVSILKKNKVAGKVPVTGQDATLQGLQNVLDGTQCMTVYKPIKQQADAAAKLAISLLKGEKAETNGTTKDTEGNRDVPSVLLTPIGIFKDNVKQVVDDGFVKQEELCAGDYADKCKEAGIQ